MKKLTAFFSAVVLSTALTPALSASADYTPSVYFVPRAETNADGTLVIDRSELENGLTITTDVFIDDESHTCWSVDPKWKCSTLLIRLTNVIDPQVPFIEYAYAETKDGELTNIRHSTACGTDDELNTMFFTCDIGRSMDRSPLTSYGENTDDYPLTSFDMVFSPDIPAGDYQVYFLTEAEDYADQRYSNVAMRTDEGSVVVVPITTPLNIKILDGSYTLGDIDNNGLIDSADASLALAAYALSSVGEDTGFSDSEFSAADIDTNGVIDSADASLILSYYSYLSTTDTPLDFAEFLKNN